MYLILVLTISCSMKTKQADRKPEIIDNKLSENKISEDSIIIENKITHNFSSLENKDEFSILIKGKSLLEGKVIFRITSLEGIEIYKEEFPPVYLIGYGLLNDASEKEQENFIKKRISEFFTEDCFSQPAIEKDSPYVEDYSNKDFWEEIKADQTSVGFRFLVGEEDNRSIAFSKKSKKVILYFNCC